MKKNTNKCPKCKCDLQIYYEKPEGYMSVIYKRCPKCTEIYEEKILHE